MTRFQTWLARSPIASWLRTFAAIVLAMFLADGADIFAVDAQDLRAWAAAGFVAVIPAVIRYINPADPLGSGRQGDRFDVWED